MATKKLTDLDYAAALTKTDLLHVNQSLIDKKDSLDSISDFIIRSSDQGFASENVVANLDLTLATITNQFKQYLFDTTAGSLNFTLPFAGGSAPSGACVMVVNDTGANNVVVEYQSGVTITLPPEGYCFIYFEGTHWELTDNNVSKTFTGTSTFAGLITTLITSSLVDTDYLHINESNGKVTSKSIVAYTGSGSPDTGYIKLKIPNGTASSQLNGVIRCVSRTAGGVNRSQFDIEFSFNQAGNPTSATGDNKIIIRGQGCPFVLPYADFVVESGTNDIWIIIKDYATPTTNYLSLSLSNLYLIEFTHQDTSTQNNDVDYVLTIDTTQPTSIDTKTVPVQIFTPYRIVQDDGTNYYEIVGENGAMERRFNCYEIAGVYYRRYANYAALETFDAITTGIIDYKIAPDGTADQDLTSVFFNLYSCAIGATDAATVLTLRDMVFNHASAGGLYGWGSTANGTISDFHGVNDRTQSGLAVNGTTNQPSSGVNYAFLHLLSSNGNNGATLAIAQQNGRVFVEGLSGGVWQGWHELASLSGFTMAGDIAMGGHNISDVGSLGSITSLTMAGNIVMGSNKVTGLSPGSLPTDAVNKNQLDAKLDIAGGTLTGTLTSRDINIQSTYFLKHNNINLMGYNVDNGGTHELVPRPIRSMILFKVVGSTETGSTLAHGLTNPVTNNKIMGIIGGYDSGTLFAGIGPGGTSAFPISVEIDDTNCYIYRSVSGSTPNAWIIVFYQD